FFFRYHIFPPEILRFFGEWQMHDRDMQEGDIIILEAKVPPIPFNIKLVFGVRVLMVESSANRMSFHYGTLTGHPETGINEFSFFHNEGTLVAEVNTTAKPGLPISQLLAIPFTIPYVAYCNRRALENMIINFFKANKSLLALQT